MRLSKGVLSDLSSFSTRLARRTCPIDPRATCVPGAPQKKYTHGVLEAPLPKSRREWTSNGRVSACARYGWKPYQVARPALRGPSRNHRGTQSSTRPTARPVIAGVVRQTRRKVSRQGERGAGSRTPATPPGVAVRHAPRARRRHAAGEARPEQRCPAGSGRRWERQSRSAPSPAAAARTCRAPRGQARPASPARRKDGSGRRSGSATRHGRGARSRRPRPCAGVRAPGPHRPRPSG